MQFNLFNSQTFHICRSQPQKKTYILEQQTDSESTTFLLSQAPNWLAAPPSISVLLAYQPADWRQYFMLDLLNKEKVFQQWHPSKNQIPAKWKSTPLLPFPDSGWLSIGGINQIRTQHGLLESNTTAVSHLQKSAEIKFKERIENHISSLIRLPKLNYQNMLYIETQQKYRYMDEDITEKIGNWLLIHSVNINNNKAYIYTRLESPLSDPTQADKNILLRDALLEQIAYNPTRQPLGILLRTAIASLCVEIHLLESKIDRDYQKYGIPLWKSN